MRKNELLQNPLPELNRQERRAVNKKVNGSKTPSSVRNVFIRVSRVNVAKEDNPKLGIKAGDTVIYETEDIYNILSEWEKTKKGITYYFIKHDKDGETDGENVHYHIVICFDNATVFNQIKARFPYGQISKCIYGVHKTVQYLVHANHPAKYQYSWDEVITNNYTKLEDFKVPYKKSMKVRLEETIQDIINGEIKEFEIEKIDSDLYIKKNKEIKKAFEYRQKSITLSPSRSVQVIILQGPPRVGKSTFCKVYAEKNNKSICFSSSSNDPWQDYAGQDIFVYDDFNYTRNKIEDLLKAFDPHNLTSVSARYKNKLFLGDTIFVCTNTPITKWYTWASDIHRQALFMRIACVLEFTDTENGISHYTVNDIVKTGRVLYVGSMSSRNEHEYSEMVLARREDKVYEFNLNNYIDVNADTDKSVDFVNQLDTI